MHDMFNMDGASKFHFDWKDLMKSRLSVEGCHCTPPPCIQEQPQMGGIFCAASFLSITASDISDQLLKDFLDMDSSPDCHHAHSRRRSESCNQDDQAHHHRTGSQQDREQKKAIRAGYDIDIIPSDLATYGRDAKAL